MYESAMHFVTFQTMEKIFGQRPWVAPWSTAEPQNAERDTRLTARSAVACPTSNVLHTDLHNKEDMKYEWISAKDAIPEPICSQNAATWLQIGSGMTSLYLLNTTMNKMI